MVKLIAWRWTSLTIEEKRVEWQLNCVGVYRGYAATDRLEKKQLGRAHAESHTASPLWDSSTLSLSAHSICFFCTTQSLGAPLMIPSFQSSRLHVALFSVLETSSLS